jgi:hypothetical protein
MKRTLITLGIVVFAELFTGSGLATARGTGSAIHKFQKITRCRHCKDAMVFNLEKQRIAPPARRRKRALRGGKPTTSRRRKFV